MRAVNKQQPIPDLQKLRPWLPVLVGSLFALAFLVVLIIARDILPLSLPLLIIASLVFLLDKRVRPNWLEVEFLTLCLAGLAIWLGTMGTTSPPSPPDKLNASFTLPADKIQSDLTCLAGLPGPPCSKPPISNVLLVLVSDHAVQYNVTLLDIKGVGSQDHKPPYNKDAVEVDVSLPQGVNGATAANFASQLQSVKSIYLFPSTSPTSTLSNLTFALPVNKIGSDLNSLLCSPNVGSNLKVGSHVTVILVVSNQTQVYSATIVSLPAMSTLTNVCATLTPTPTPSVSTKGSATPIATPTSQPATIGIQLMNATNDKVIDFANQLPNTMTIYILQQ